jgi:hypothetical protein
VAFSLIVDDFAVKYVGIENEHHLPNTLLKYYKITTDWGATTYSGMTLKWDYKHRTCDTYMPGYVPNILNKFQHPSPKHPTHTPSKYVTPIYGAKTQYATEDETALLDAKQCLRIQKISGSVLYYARSVDPSHYAPQ